MFARFGALPPGQLYQSVRHFLALVNKSGFAVQTLRMTPEAYRPACRLSEATLTKVMDVASKVSNNELFTMRHIQMTALFLTK